MLKKMNNKPKPGAAERKGLWQAQKEKWQKEPKTLVTDLSVLLLGFIFGRGHLAFGAYPLGIAFVAVLPSSVPMAALGSFLGSLSLGKTGVIFALVCAVTFMLRLVLSSNEGQSGRGRLFKESISLRVCAAVIGGFLSGVYQMLLSGLTATSAATALTMILAPGIATFVFSGLFDAGVSL